MNATRPLQYAILFAEFLKTESPVFDPNRIYKPNDPEVEAARERFEKNKNRRDGCLTFLERFLLYQAHYSLKLIARLDGTTINAKRVEYRTYFQDLCGGRSYENMLEEEHNRRHLSRHEKIMKGELAPAINRARTFGCEIALIPLASASGYRLREILLDGECYAVKEVRTCRFANRRSKRVLVSFAFNKARLERIDGEIWYINVPGYPQSFYKIPSADLIEEFFPLGTDRTEAIQYICPIQLPPHNNRLPRFNVEIYRDRWKSKSEEAKIIQAAE